MFLHPNPTRFSVLVVHWFKTDRRTVIRDVRRPSWYMRVDNMDEAKKYIDQVGGQESMAAFNENYYAAYSLDGEWVASEKSKTL